MKVGGGEPDIAAMKPAMSWLQPFEYDAREGRPDFRSDHAKAIRSSTFLDQVKNNAEMAPAFFGPKLSFDGRRMSMRGAGRISERERISDVRSICMKRRRPWGDWW